MSAKGDMLAGKWYNANFDSELLKERITVKDFCLEYNNTPMKDLGHRRDVLREILQNVTVEHVEILSPFMVDYGYNVFMGSGCFLNHNVYLMDCAKITFGKKCFIGPNCGFYTALHPMEFQKRNAGYEQAKPITVGDNVWIGGGVTILPGVKIGNNSVIGAGSVVTKDIPANVLAFGNPCRVVREIPVSKK
jgi:acetyltransferase-like isoleucine patch superfamily enzyme